MWPIIPPCNNRYAKSAVGIVTGREKPNCVDKNLLQCHNKKLKTVFNYGVGTNGKKKTNGLSYCIDNNADKMLRKN